MSASKLGTKHECISCGVKFYDLGKPRPICPKCGTDQKKPADEEDTPEVEDQDANEPEAKGD